jgi:uncharacterized glyoxalase superfamily protein PhnB
MEDVPMTPNIFPTLRCRDAHASIDFLIRAFGFEKQAVFESPDGGVGHAQLRFGAGVLGLNSATSTPPGSPWAAVRQGIYMCVPEVDAHHDRARAAGAPIVAALTDQSYGSRDYAVRDPEGHLWGFGTYDMQAPEGEPTIFIGLHYHDGRAALSFLERAFGFRTSLEVPGQDGGIAHAEMRLGDGAIFIDSGPRDPASWGENVEAIHVYVADPDAHHGRAAAQGAHITAPPFDTPWARGYYARDLDGFLWGFSTYKPAA